MIVANFGNNWGFHLLMTELPLYLSDVFPDYMNSGSKTGLWTAIPYGTMWLTSVLVSFITDYLVAYWVTCWSAALPVAGRPGIV